MATFFRSDGWVKSTLGPAVAGALIYVCDQPANAPVSGTPSPLAPVFADSNGLVPIVQPIVTDGFGHYDFYVLPGTYTVLVYNAGQLQQVYPDQSVAVGGSNPAISPNDSIQYNANGVLNGFSQFLFDPSTGIVKVGPTTTTYINNAPNPATPTTSPTLQIAAGNPFQYMPNPYDQQWAGIGYSSVFTDFPSPTGSASQGFEVNLYLNKGYSPSIDPSLAYQYCSKMELYTDRGYTGDSTGAFISPLGLVLGVNSPAQFGQAYGLLIQANSVIPLGTTVSGAELSGIFVSSLLGDGTTSATYNYAKAVGVNITPPTFFGPQSGSISLSCGLSVESPGLGSGDGVLLNHQGVRIASQVNGNPGGRNSNAWGIHEDDATERNALGSINLGGETGPLVSTGTGSPEGVVTSVVGGLYLRTDSPTAIYSKVFGSGNTGWTPVTSVMGVTDDRSAAVVSTTLDSSLDKSAVVIVAPVAPLFVVVNPDLSDNGGWQAGFYFYLWNKGTSTVTLASTNASDTFNGSATGVVSFGQVSLCVTDGNGAWTVVPVNAVAGPDKALQFNSLGVVSGDAGLTWDKTLKKLAYSTSLNTSVATGVVGLSGNVVQSNNSGAIAPTVTGIFVTTSYSGTATPTAAASVTNALFASVGDLNTDSIAALIGLELNAIGGHAAATYSTILGLQSIAATSTTGTCTNISGIETYWRGESHPSTIGTAHGIHIKSPQNAASVTVTTNTALQIDDPTLGGAATNYAIKVDGGKSSFKAIDLTSITAFNGINTVGNGVPVEYAAINLTGQTAGIGTTTLYAVPASGAGLYRVTFYAKITTAGTGSVHILGGTNGFQVRWTDRTDSVVVTAPLVDTFGSVLSANTTSTVESGSVVVDCKASTNLQYSYDYISSGNTMAYKLSAKVEYLG
jgi:hypothetical protein